MAEKENDIPIKRIIKLSMNLLIIIIFGFEYLSANIPPKKDSNDIETPVAAARVPTNKGESVSSYDNHPMAVSLHMNPISFILFAPR